MGLYDGDYRAVNFLLSGPDMDPEYAGKRVLPLKSHNLRAIALFPLRIPHSGRKSYIHLFLWILNKTNI